MHRGKSPRGAIDSPRSILHQSMGRTLGIALALGFAALGACVVDNGNSGAVDRDCAQGSNCDCDGTGSCTYD